MNKIRRVAIGINLGFPYSHHFGPFGGIQRYARERGHWECHVEPFVQLVRQKHGGTNYDGVIARASGELADQAAKLGVPVVNLWSGSPAKELPGVWPDFGVCARMATEHLLARGYRRFAFLGFVRNRGTVDALAGFKAVLREAKCPWTVQLTSTNWDESSNAWRRCTDRLEKWIATWKPPLGVLTVLDTFARYVADACLRLGLRIPDDVALIGFGNEPLICMNSEPSLSTISQGYDRVGYEAAALLDRLMDGETPPKAPLLIEPTELIIRRSTDIYVVDDLLVRQAVAFISNHSHEGIRVDDVAEHVHVSRRSLDRHFHDILGRTITEEICRLRLERAKRLLVESDAQIKEVALDCGFATAQYFSEVFLAAEGIPPGEYRRRHTL